jgi:DNA-binding NtrC family response regulator
VLEICVPPLRERREDIAALVQGLLPSLSQRNRRRVHSISKGALAKLSTYDWPGNIRELQNLLERALVLCEGGVIEAKDLALPKTATVLARETKIATAVPTEIMATGSVDHAREMRALEKQRLVLILEQAEGNKSSAARALGMPRSTFLNKLRRHDLL